MLLDQQDVVAAALSNQRSLLFFHSQLDQASILRFEGVHARVSIHILTLLTAAK